MVRNDKQGLPLLGLLYWVTWDEVNSILFFLVWTERCTWLIVWISQHQVVSQLRDCVLHDEKWFTEVACPLPTLVLSTIKVLFQICGSHIGSGTVKSALVYVKWKSYPFCYGWSVPSRAIFLQLWEISNYRVYDDDDCEVLRLIVSKSYPIKYG